LLPLLGRPGRHLRWIRDGVRGPSRAPAGHPRGGPGGIKPGPSPLDSGSGVRLPGKEPFPLNATIKNLLLWMVILVLIILAWNVFKTGAAAIEEVSFSQFLDQVSQGHVQKVSIRGEEIRGTYSPAAGKREPLFKTYAANYPDLVKDLRAKGVE